MTALLLVFCLVALTVCHRVEVYPWLVVVKTWTMRSYALLTVLLLTQVVTQVVGP